MSIEDHIIKTTVRYEFMLFGAIESLSDYSDLLHVLRDAQDGDSVLLKINSPGGDIDTGMMIVQAIQKSAAVTVCDVVYPSASMASIIAVCGDYMVMQKNAFLMFHTYYMGSGGKSADLMKSLVHYDESLKAMFDDTCTPFLTKKEIKKMHEGDDIYIKADDPTLPARLKRKFKDVDIQKK